MSETPQDELFSGADLARQAALEIAANLVVVKATGPLLGFNRAMREEIESTERKLRAVEAWLSGEYDRTLGFPGFTPEPEMQAGREKWANDAARDARHHLVWAEHYADLRSKESALSADPYRVAS